MNSRQAGAERASDGIRAGVRPLEAGVHTDLADRLTYGGSPR